MKTFSQNMKIFLVILWASGVSCFVFSRECGENESFTRCGTWCPLTCSNRWNPPEMCIRMCYIGCECDQGYVKSDNGTCILPKDCPDSTTVQISRDKECEEHQHYTRCGTTCPLTCVNHRNPPLFCVMMCYAGCECDQGYVKNFNGSCVLPTDCPERDDTSVCELPKEHGRCFGYFPRYYFDQVSGHCDEFIYGGCGGNENHFKTIEECRSLCEQRVTALEATITRSEQNPVANEQNSVSNEQNHVTNEQNPVSNE